MLGFFIAGVPSSEASRAEEFSPDAKTVLLWHLNEDAGTSAEDASGNGRDGTIVSAGRTTGRFGLALSFAGGPAGSQYVLLADSDALTPSVLTIDIWIKPTRLDLDNQMIVHKYQNNVPSNSDYILLLTNDTLGFGTRGTEVLATTLPTVDTWYQITAIADGADSRLYVNGVLAASGFLSPIPKGTQPLVVGSCLFSCEVNNHSFAGIIDELRISSSSVIPGPMDTDGDGVFDFQDNCPTVSNAEQTDTDGDGTGDACDSDVDNDGLSNDQDNCPFTPNADQADLDHDGRGDACDDDPDGDGVVANDNCPTAPNTDQTDTDADGVGDACDSDDDNDGVCDSAEGSTGCMGGPDNCATVPNSAQADLDHDAIGDACDADLDGDGIDNSPDNCPLDANPDQNDADHDGLGDACDSDDDNDGVPDAADNCPFVPNLDQSDFDHDGLGDVCDADRDGDAIPTADDNCPDVPNTDQRDLDSDGAGDACDSDVDGDGVPNESDICAGTPQGAVVDPRNGCSIAQLCPCATQRGTTTAWRNHGAYVSCVAHVAGEFVMAELITEAEKDAMVSTAAQSACGTK